MQTIEAGGVAVSGKKFRPTLLTKWRFFFLREYKLRFAFFCMEKSTKKREYYIQTLGLEKIFALSKHLDSLNPQYRKECRAEFFSRRSASEFSSGWVN